MELEELLERHEHDRQGRRVPVAAPVLAGNERAYVMDCLDSGWISSSGKYVGLFERSFAEFCGVRHAVCCSNGTVALHLALMAMGVGAGDEVIVPTLTFVATANAVTYCGARPVFTDSEPRTWNLDPAAIEARITPRTRGIIAVHLYGHPADMDAVRRVAARHNLFVIEDAAEAHGAIYRNRSVGSLGEVATFSFYGNKIISTGEGGMVVTNDDQVADRVRLLRGQGMDAERRYWFPIVGYNYRMTNIAAAIGLAQMEQVEWHVARRREIATWYRAELSGESWLTFQAEEAWARHAYWMVTVLLNEHFALPRDEVMRKLAQRGIETRPVFYPVSALPAYAGTEARREQFPIAESIARRGICLPTWAGLTGDDIKYVCDALKEVSSA